MLDAYNLAADMSLTHISALLLLALPVVLIASCCGAYKLAEASAAFIRQIEWNARRKKTTSVSAFSVVNVGYFYFLGGWGAVGAACAMYAGLAAIWYIPHVAVEIVRFIYTSNWRTLADMGHVRLAKKYAERGEYTKAVEHALAATRLVNYQTASARIESVRYLDIRTIASYAPLIALLAAISAGCGAEAITLLSAAAVAPLGSYAYTPGDKTGRRAELESGAAQIEREFTPAELRNGDALEHVAAHMVNSGRSELGMQLCRLVARLRDGSDISRELYHLATTHDDLGPMVFPTYTTIRNG